MGWKQNLASSCNTQSMGWMVDEWIATKLSLFERRRWTWPKTRRNARQMHHLSFGRPNVRRSVPHGAKYFQFEILRFTDVLLLYTHHETALPWIGSCSANMASSKIWGSSLNLTWPQHVLEFLIVRSQALQKPTKAHDCQYQTVTSAPQQIRSGNWSEPIFFQ